MVPRSPAGQRLAWYLASLSQRSDDLLTRDAVRFVPAFRFPRSVGLGDRRELEVAAIEESSPLRVTATLVSKQGRRWRLTCAVEAAPPTVLRSLIGSGSSTMTSPCARRLRPTHVRSPRSSGAAQSCSATGRSHSIVATTTSRSPG